MDFVSKSIADYSERHTTEESALLKKVNRETWQKVYMPRMLSGHLQGRILSMFSQMIKPDRILEIGTFTGYSALCLAEGLTPKGRLITIDKNEELEDLVRQTIRDSPYAEKIDFHVGDAYDIVKSLNEKWDLVFIDADKTNYATYYNLILQNVHQGGIIIADNVLWSGKVIKETTKSDPETESLQIFNKMIQEDSSVENVLMPVRDGLMVIRKL